MKVYKYGFEDGRYLYIENGYVPLYVGTQCNKGYIWCLVNPDNEKTSSGLFMIGTGQELKNWNPETCEHIGTFCVTRKDENNKDADVVIHIFRRYHEGNN